MRTSIITLVLLLGFSAFSQDHFAGISTSDRVGILNGDLNPAEFSNLSKKFEVNIYGMSFNVANNKIGFNDITSGKNLEDLIFAGNESVNMRLDTRVIGPSFALKIGKWGFGITTKANIKFDIVNVDPTIGNAISNNNLTLATTILNTNSNQRFSGTSWGEVGLSAAKKIIDNDKHTFSAGLTVKLLFPGSYTNVGLNNLNGQITETATGASDKNIGCFELLKWMMFWYILLPIKIVQFFINRSKPPKWSITDTRKEELILNFPVPMSREEIIEFLTLAVSKINSNTYFNAFSDDMKNKGAWNAVWFKKIQQIQSKASIAMINDKASLEIVDKIVLSATQSINENNKKILHISIAFAAVVILLIIMMSI